MLILGALFLAAGCGAESPRQSTVREAHVSCAGKPCGEQCFFCAPDDPGCLESAAVKTCKQNGVCSASPATCAIGYNPCAGLGCGDACLLCPPGDPACEEMPVARTCDTHGH